MFSGWAGHISTNVRTFPAASILALNPFMKGNVVPLFN